MFNSKTALLAVLILTPSLGFADPSQDPFFNEAFDEKGQLRPQYKKVWPIVRRMSKKQRMLFFEATNADFNGDNALTVAPRLILDSEYDTLQRGVVQRGTALKMFLQDHYSGEKRYAEKVIPSEVVERIIRRSGDEGFEGFVDPDRINFPYGPDIIRDPQGAWRVLEDNTGFIGGTGDLEMARRSLMKRFPRSKRTLEPVDKPVEYYENMAKLYKASSKDGIPVVYMAGLYVDSEYTREKELMERFGVKVITLDSEEKLTSTPGGLFLTQPNNKTQKVGFLKIHGEHAWFANDLKALRVRSMMGDLLWFSTKGDISDENRAEINRRLEKFYETGEIDEASHRKFMSGLNVQIALDGNKAQTIPNLMTLYRKGAFEMDYTPGVDFVGDKEFTVYVEDLIRFYLGEEPILKNVETHPLWKLKDGKIVPDEERLSAIAKDKDNWVIKQTNGRGGQGIWVGPKESEEEWLKAQAAAREKPSSFQVQRFTHPSVLDDYIVDMRMISHVGKKSVFVAPTPWGRALPISGNGKVNISGDGLEQAIAVVREKHSSCPGRLMSFFRPFIRAHQGL